MSYQEYWTVTEFADCIDLKVEMEEITRMIEFLRSAAEDVGLNDKKFRQLRMAAEEAVSNIINYSEADMLSVKVWHRPEGMEVTIEDNGKPFDPTTVEEPDLSLPGEERPIGGLGIHYIRHMSDEMSYRRDDGKNILTISKNL